MAEANSTLGALTTAHQPFFYSGDYQHEVRHLLAVNEGVPILSALRSANYMLSGACAAFSSHCEEDSVRSDSWQAVEHLMAITSGILESVIAGLEKVEEEASHD